MIKINPEFIKDAEGRKLVVLSQKEFEDILEELEEMADIRLYDEAMKNDAGERIPMEEAFKIIEAKR